MKVTQERSRQNARKIIVHSYCVVLPYVKAALRKFKRQNERKIIVPSYCVVLPSVRETHERENERKIIVHPYCVTSFVESDARQSRDKRGWKLPYIKSYVLPLE